MASGLVSCHAALCGNWPKGSQAVVGMLVGGVGLEFPASASLLVGVGY